MAMLLLHPRLAMSDPPHRETRDMEELLRRGSCLLCHRWQRPWIGPSFQQIAQGRRGLDAQGRAGLVLRLRQGSVGNHSPIPMGPCDVSRLSDEELSVIIDWLLAVSPSPSSPGSGGSR